MSRQVYVILFFSFLFFNCTQPKKTTLTIVNFDGVDESNVLLVESEIKRIFKIDTIIIKQDQLPDSAYYQPRNRYKATTLLNYLNKVYSTEKVVALTTQDISIKKGEHEDWGIMGLGNKPGKSCIISTFRIKKKIKNKEHFNQRLSKVASHEIGHTLGLPHCENSEACLMRDANGKVITVDETNYFCSSCQSKIKGYLN